MLDRIVVIVADWLMILSVVAIVCIYLYDAFRNRDLTQVQLLVRNWRLWVVLCGSIMAYAVIRR